MITSLTKVHVGDGRTYMLKVASVSIFPRGDDGTCVFCKGDPCAENAGNTIISRYYERNPSAVTCPVCDGRPT